VIRLAVVHYQEGPLQGGEYDDLQEPGLEERDEYVGEQQNPNDRPYCGEGEDRIQDVPGKSKRRLRLDSKKVVGIDFDGTVTADPRFFRDLVARLRKAGSKVHLITGRSYVDKAEVDRYCDLYGLNFSAKHFYPLPYRSDWVGWDTLLEVRIGSWKAKVLSDLNAEAMIEDNDVFISQIVARLPTITVLKPVGG